MKELKAILLEDTDVKNKEQVMTSLTDEAAEACAMAAVVVFNGRVVKNRLGEIDSMQP